MPPSAVSQARHPAALGALSWALTASLVVLSAPGAVAAPCGGARVQKDIAYSEQGGALTSLDVYSPGLEAAGPVMVYVHGGGWVGGDKSKVDDKPRFWNTQGFVFVSVNYRLSPRPDDPATERIRHPTHAQDVAEALAWVHARIGGWCGDPARIVLMGHSAGAGIAANIATDPRLLARVGKKPDILRGVILNDTGSYDIPRLMAKDTDISRKIYRNAFGDDPAAWTDASPIHHVAAHKGIPDVLIIYRGWQGRRDMATDFAAALKRAGVKVEAIHASGLSHREVNEKISEPGHPLAKAAVRFAR